MRFKIGKRLVEKEFYGTFDSIVDENGHIIAFVWSGEMDPDGEANARLIAAAPDLLAACKVAFAMLEERGNPFAGDDWELGHRLSAAIGKAQGDPECS